MGGTATGDVVRGPGGGMDVTATCRNMIAGYMADGVAWLREYGAPCARDIAEQHGYQVKEAHGETLYLRPEGRGES